MSLISDPPHLIRERSVFLSYARADDDPNYDDPTKSFLRRLYNDLTAAGFQVWWDRESLPARGETFTVEIELAIREVERFILVVGEGTVKSEYVRKEWEFALSRCLPITPILRRGDYSLIPATLRDINAIDCRESRMYPAALKDVINRLHDDAMIGSLVNVPSLPEGFLMREKPFKAAHAAIRADSINPVRVNAPPHAVAVYGYGGIGKSTLAAALAVDCDIRRRYTDGVIWLTIGQTPNLVSRQIDIGRLFNDSRDYYTDAESGKLRLSWLLTYKHVKALFVLDDVWDYRVVEHFPVNGTACCVLLTTRSPQIAGLIQGADVRLDLLTPEEGAALIATRTGGDPHDEDSKAISRELGGLTLAITLAAAQIAEKYADSPADMLRLLNKVSEGDTPFRDLIVDEADKDLNLEKSLALSYAKLTSDMQRRFRELGVLALDAPFDRALAAAVWGDVDEDMAREPLTALGRVGLIENEGIRVYTMHRILRMYAHALLIREGAVDAAFVPYADRVIALAEGFHNIPPERWNELTMIMPHLHAVGDVLMQRLPALSDNSTHEGEWKRARAFAYNVVQYLSNRREVYHIDWLEMGLKASQVLDDKASQALFFNEIGETYSVRGRKEEALGHYANALTLREDLHDEIGQAATLTNMAEAYMSRGTTQMALDCCKQALELCQKHHDSNGLAMALNNLGWIHARLANYALAYQCYSDALARFRKTQDKRGEANVLSNLGDALSNLGRVQEALRHYEEALPIRREIQDKRGEATTLNNLGQIYHTSGKLQEALDYLEQALVIRTEIQDLFGKAITLDNIGAIHDARGDIVDALHNFGDALKLHRTLNDHFGEAITLTNLGSLHGKLNQEDRAVQELEQALTLHQQVGNKRGKAGTLKLLGLLFRTKDNIRSAVYLKEALATFQQIDDKFQQGTINYALGLIYLENGQPALGLQTFEEALSFFDETTHPDDCAQLHWDIGNVSMHLQFFSNVLTHFEKALSLSQAKDLAQQAELCRRIAIAYVQLKNLAKAIEFQSRCVDLAVQINSPHVADYQTELDNLMRSQ